MRIILSILLSVLLIISSAHGRAAKKMFCRDFILETMGAIEEKALPEFRDPLFKCMESKDKDKGYEFHCEKKKNISKEEGKKLMALLVIILP
ncbi:hypothetical protein TNIN_111361 [Trichonephila inaurata madagascariensis]|uniref:Uncharacterized protein n=1 Tax=Trichonephila inaurata madagascariensis TaxID=2747483 RepID=A0A8X6X2A6_9ARAC|nr:hypothetical protein TNIN_111361 [Trichonephila inaurata madagascariensis]